MEKSSRILNLIIAAALLVFVIVIIAVPDRSPYLIVIVLGIGLMLYGLHGLVFFFTMARHMIGGKRIFFRGLLCLDLGVFIFSGYNNGSDLLILLYLVVYLFLSGVIALLHAREAKRSSSPWKLHFVQAIFNLGIGVIGLIFIRSIYAVVYVFAAYLTITALNRLLTAMRRNAVIFIPQ